MSVQTFSNGLEISKDHVRLAQQTWAVGMIKRVGIGPAGTGLGTFICGVLGLAFGYTAIHSYFSRVEGSVMLMAHVFAFLCAYGVYASYKAVKTSQVWIQTGMMPVFIFNSRDALEAQKVKAVLEEAISAHRPSFTPRVDGIARPESDHPASTLASLKTWKSS